MKSGLAVIGICLVISGFLAVVVKKQFQTDLVATQDLVLGLIYFMERHEGRMPASEEEFLAEPYVVATESGGIKIAPPEETRYNPNPHGFEIADLAPFKVNWGRDLSDLELDKYGRVRDPDGNKVELASWPGSPPSGKGYTVILLGASRDIEALAQPGPPSDVHPDDSAE